MKSLTQLQKDIISGKKTEPPFDNLYWNHFEDGIYIDVVDQTPLFLSTDKFKSSSGWPSFSKTIDENVYFKQDFSFDMLRLEVLATNSKSHLGHLFEDGPKELGGLRYCVNSAALEFIPVSELKNRGFEKYLKYFK